jgi:four helix bundle protein
MFKSMKRNIIKEKSYSFSVRIINLTRVLKNRKAETVIVNQLLRSGTSIAANVEEAFAGISKADFSMKLSISYKEAKETGCWLRMLKDTASISEMEFNSIYKDLEEILRILWAILKKTRMNNKK